MVFFDLNVPFLDGDDRASEKDNSARRAARLKVVVKLMELGYTGVAYNRTIRGVMSDSDRCKIPYFPLSSLLKAAPTLSFSVGFHRQLLGVPPSTPFRQYTRLTVSVDSAIAAAGLNSGNPVLRTYDLVSVRPLNQIAFDQACKVSEVDVISIDFSQNLPFRLKLPMVKTAIKRGVCFEITYSHLISDVHLRRKMLSGAKLLVDWTQGKNLIFASAAPSVKELRGPYDVANLSSLLGLSMERAKAAISRNCRSLLAIALRKKHCYKQAIRIEKLPPDKQVDSKEAWFREWNNWDPISSGEGDLPFLDDIAKDFSVASRVSESYSAIDFVSVADGMSSKDSIFNDGGDLVSAGGKASSLSTFMESEPSSAANEAPQRTSSAANEAQQQPSSAANEAQQQPSSAANEAPQQDMLIEVPVSDRISSAEGPLENILSGNKDDMVSLSDTAGYFSDTKEPSYLITDKIKVGNSGGSDTSEVRILSYNTPSKNRIPPYEGKLEAMDDSSVPFYIPVNVKPSDVCREDPESSDRLGITSCFDASEGVAYELEASITDSMDTDPSFVNVEEVKMFSGLDAVSDAHRVPLVQTFASGEEMGQYGSVLDAYGIEKKEELPKNELSKHGDDAIPSTDKMLFGKSFAQMNVQEQRGVVSVADDVLLNEYEVKLEEKEQEGSLTVSGVRQKNFKSGKNRLRKKLGRRALPFPFKGFLNPRHFKKKICNIRGRKTNLRID